ncbi:hypothetical protein CBM2587_B30012 [Cupriavidus taiwanensis]|uniref:Uncharacterized protein n=1 Tax=Cupriavidus taiwanensis TaxID=164546 RepID=A0A975X872_9BURK|nr:hypothetical protein CBM2587_B30012 [Cupriavidus taiwanensis]
MRRPVFRRASVRACLFDSMVFSLRGWTWTGAGSGTQPAHFGQEALFGPGLAVHAQEAGGVERAHDVLRVLRTALEGGFERVAQRVLVGARCGGAGLPDDVGDLAGLLDMALACHVVGRRTLPGHQVRVVREAFHCAWLHVLQQGDRVPRALATVFGSPRYVLLMKHWFRY